MCIIMLERESGNEKRANSEIPNQVWLYLYTYIYYIHSSNNSSIRSKRRTYIVIYFIGRMEYLYYMVHAVLCRS